MTEHYPMASSYLAACRRAFEVTAAGGRITLFRSDGRELDAAGWRREFLEALDRRINAKGGLPVAAAPWRKLDGDWQRHARQDADRINAAGTRRLRVYSTEITTDDWRRRFARLYAEGR